MKKMSKLLALLLVLAMMFSLAACESASKKEKKDTDANPAAPTSAEPAAPTIIGEWDCEMNISDAMKQIMVASLGSDELAPAAKLRMNINFEFNDNGKLEMNIKINEDDFKKYVEELCDKMVDYLYETLEAQGLTKELADELINAQYGMSMEDYVKETMDAAVGEAIVSMNRTETMYYELDEEAGVFYTAYTEEELEEKKEAFEYKLEGDKLTLVNVLENGEPAENPLAAYGLELPWVFERQ